MIHTLLLVYRYCKITITKLLKHTEKKLGNGKKKWLITHRIGIYKKSNGYLELKIFTIKNLLDSLTAYYIEQ